MASGTQRWLAAQEDPRLQVLEDSAFDSGLFNEALAGLRQELWRIYESSGARGPRVVTSHQVLFRWRNVAVAAVCQFDDHRFAIIIHWRAGAFLAQIGCHVPSTTCRQISMLLL